MARIGLKSVRAALPRSVKSFLTEHLPYKAAALFLSIVLWIVVERQTPRATIGNFDVRLVLVMDSALVRVSPLPEVMVRLSVSADDILKLETNPPHIRLSFANDVDDSVEVKLDTRDVLLPEGVRAKGLQIEPSSFVVRFDSLAQKTVPIRSALRISPAIGVAIAGAPRFQPDSVSIVGRRQVVVRIQSVSTEDRDWVVADSAAVSVKLVPPAPGIGVVPAEVDARVPIIKTSPR